ncbi:MAG: histidine phosphatase family protein [Acidobacteriota bacterium]
MEKKIILVRHGEPDVKKWESERNGSYGEWVKAYNSAGIKNESRPSEELKAAVEGCDLIISSDLRRAVETAEALCLSIPVRKEPVLREIELPESKRKLPKFSPEIWATIFRILWFFGVSGNVENLREAKERIKKASEKILSVAEDNNKIVVVGHGLINRFIAGELKSNGWSGPKYNRANYWDFFEYRKRY